MSRASIGRLGSLSLCSIFTSGQQDRKGLMWMLELYTFRSWSPSPRVTPMVAMTRAYGHGNMTAHTTELVTVPEGATRVTFFRFNSQKIPLWRNTDSGTRQKWFAAGKTLHCSPICGSKLSLLPLRLNYIQIYISLYITFFQIQNKIKAQD